MCSSRALSRLRAVAVSCWGVVFGSLHSCLVLVFVSGFGHSRSRLVLLWEHAVSSSLGPCALLSVCVVFCSARGSGSAACFFVVLFCVSVVLSCSVWHAACVFHWLRAFMFVMFCVNAAYESPH